MYNRKLKITWHFQIFRLVLFNGLFTWDAMLVWEKENKPKEKQDTSNQNLEIKHFKFP